MVGNDLQMNEMDTKIKSSGCRGSRRRRLQGDRGESEDRISTMGDALPGRQDVLNVELEPSLAIPLI